MNLVRHTVLWSLPVAVLVFAAGTLISNVKSGGGGLLGIAVADFEIAAMAFLARMLVGFPAGPRVIQTTILFAFLKLPLVALAVYLATQLGSAAVGWFLAGVGLVYLELVRVALRESKTEERGLFS